MLLSRGNKLCAHGAGEKLVIVEGAEVVIGAGGAGFAGAGIGATFGVGTGGSMLGVAVGKFPPWTLGCRDAMLGSLERGLVEVVD